MKVLQINATFGQGSTGVIVEHLHQCCLQNGIKSYIACPILSDVETKNDNFYKIGNWCTRKWHALMSRIAGKQAYYSKCSTRRFIKWVQSINPDVVHLHNLHSNYIHLNLLLKYLSIHDIPTIITMHDCWYFTGGCFHYTNVECSKWHHRCGRCPKRMEDTPSYLYDATKKILKDRKKYLTSIPRLYLVGCSKWVVEEAKKSVLKNCNIQHINNGFDLDIFRPTPSSMAKKLGLEGKHILLGAASKWLSTVNKETLNYFIKEMPDNYILVLFGASEHKYLYPNVMLYGYTANQYEMAQLYSMAEVFVNCSREDTLSSLNLEAQACGTPVVTYEATGNKETVGEGCGYVVETGNACVLWMQAKRVIETKDGTFSIKCQKWVKQEFDKKNYEKYVQLYREAVGESIVDDIVN